MTDAAPARSRAELTHVDGLDGLRGLAIAAVLLCDGGVSWASGGFLGVELFLVLSGFLITSLLLRDVLERGTVAVADFWSRRTRRLAPALCALVIVVGVYSAIQGTFGAVPGLFGDGLSGLLGYANWHQIAAGSGYLVTAGPTSPFQHLWFLAIEAQFCLLWPLLIVALAAVCIRRGGSGAGAPSERDAIRTLNVLLGATVAMLIGSAVECAALWHQGSGLTRITEGSDTHAYGLLLGAVLAIAMARLRRSDHAARWSERARPSGGPMTAAISFTSIAVLAGVCVILAGAHREDGWLYPLGSLLTDVLSVLLIVVILASPTAIASRLFALAPLRWIGRISYGLYLWHFPLFLWITASGSLVGAKLFLVRALATLAAAVASYVLIEQPVRERRWPGWIVRSLAPVSLGAGAVALALATSAGAVPSTPTPTHRASLVGTQTCQVHLANTTYMGEVAPPLAELSIFELKALGHGKVKWPTGQPADQKTVTFHTCDPTPRALVIGDSIAFTLGVPYLYNEQKYGVAISDAAVLGCAFESAGQLDNRGTLETVPPRCDDAAADWAQEAGLFGAKVVIVELGYRNEFDWKLDGRLPHLGQPSYDNYIEAQIRSFIKVVGNDGKRKLLFLSIPYVAPEKYADGQPEPQTTAARHREINALLTQAVSQAGSAAEVLDIDKIISPDNRYAGTVDGRLCRTDGIHISTFCADLLERPIFQAARQLLAK